jgi:hypothetical protein
MKTMIVTMDESGTLTFLVDEDTQALLNEGSVVQRASYVEPVSRTLRCVFHSLRSAFGDKGWAAAFTRRWPCLWRVNLSPVGKSILKGNYKNRQAAIDAEVLWLNENFI